MVERVDDLYLPLATVNRFIKSNLPEGVALSKEARLAVSRAASIFVLYCTAASNEIAQHADRRTILPNDVLGALHDMDFTEFVKPLQTALDDFKKTNASNKASAKDNKDSERPGSRSGSAASKKKAPAPSKGKGKGGNKRQKATTSDSNGGLAAKNGDGATAATAIDADTGHPVGSDDEAREGEPAVIKATDLATRPEEDDVDDDEEIMDDD